MNNNEPLVSILIPVYNSEKFIRETLDSVLSQTYKNFEVIIVDDACTDNTPKILIEFAELDTRINLFRNDTNLYIAKARNKAISLSKGKYIVWQDSDDISLPTRVEKLVKFMEEHPDVGICGSYLQSFMGEKDLDVRTYATDDESLRKTIFKYSPVAQPTAIVRKSCLDEVGVFDESIPTAEDLDLSFRIGVKYKFANIPEVLIRYREHPNSATHLKLKAQIRNTLRIRLKYSKGYGYKMSLSDYIAYAVTSFTSILPARLTINLFKFFRKITRG